MFDELFDEKKPWCYMLKFMFSEDYQSEMYQAARESVIVSFFRVDIYPADEHSNSPTLWMD
jgi:hypothetical protein